MIRRSEESSDGEDNIETKSLSISSLSPAIVQAVYKEMLDTTETLSKSFSPGKIVDRGDIKAFCERFLQTCQQYNVKGLKTSFLIRRDEDHTERYTSLDRFLASDSQGGRITAGLVVELSFLISPPNHEKYQEYKASLLIDSSDFTQRDDNESFFLNMVRVPTFAFSVEYVDYAVARTFLSMAEEWHKSLNTVKSSPILDFIKRHFNIFTDGLLYQNASALISTVASSYAVYSLIDVWDFDGTHRDLVLFILVCSLMVYISRYISITSIGFFIRYLGKYRIPNFVLLNKKDTENVAKYEAGKRSIVWMSLFSLFAIVGTIAINIASSYIYSKLFG